MQQEAIVRDGSGLGQGGKIGDEKTVALQYVLEVDSTELGDDGLAGWAECS